MKIPFKTWLAIGLLGGGLAFAQEKFGGTDGPPPHPHHRPPPPLLLQVLDANHDGVIDAQEIANASVALLKLDKNGDGKLTPDELCPHCPEPGHGPEGEPGEPPPGPGNSSP